MSAERPIITISRADTGDGGQELAGFNLARPESGSTEPVYSFPLAGWALGARAPVQAIHIYGAQRRLPQVPVTIERADIAELYPEIPWAARAGFAARLNVIHLPARFELKLSAVLENGTTASLGEIAGERRRLPAQEDASFQPILLTTVGRSGSTWLTWLLGRHPEIMDYRSFQFEPHVASYFAEVLRALTQPSSYFQSLRGDIDNSGWWLGKHPRWGLPWYSCDPAVQQWLGTSYVEELIGFFARVVDGLYRRLALASGKPEATFFVEKFPPIYFAQRMLWEVFPGTREIFLVRDFRDVACSMFAFGEKRGQRWYYEKASATDEECIREFFRDDVDEFRACWSERADKAYLLRYESLVLHPNRTLAGLFDYLGVDSSPNVVEEVLREGARLDPDVEREHATSATAADSVGRWRRELDAPLRQACEEALGDALSTFGYA